MLLLCSCDNFLNESMRSDYSPENYYTSEDAAAAAVVGVYASLYGTKWWIFGDVASDDAAKGGNAGDQAGMDGIDAFTATSDNGDIAVFWQKTYETVSQANNVIAYVQPMNIPTRDHLIGEARFIRAFSYFQLVNIFGAVPYKDKPQTTADAIHVALSTPDIIYSKIEADLQAAADALPPSYGAAERGRVTQGAALALLAKTYLYQKKYSECLAAIQRLEDLQQYTLLNNYADLFHSGAEDSTEVIFGLRFAQSTEVSLGNEFTVWMAPSIESGYHFNAPTQAFVDCFTEQTATGSGDPRLDASIGRNGKPWFNGLTFSDSWSEATGYLVKKYCEDNPSARPIGYSTIPYHYLRYADLLLMQAEALNELGAAGANVPLNSVRRRAGLADTTAAQSTLRAIIRTERRRELGFECHRFYDLMRYGREYAEQALVGTGFTWQEPRYYFPLPQMEVDANNKL
ncbi:membrane protein [Bacteroidia bacterium]|nr:membrane protein [Bacteroidia bacterium]